MKAWVREKNMRRSIAMAGMTLFLGACVSQDMPTPGEGAALFAENCAMSKRIAARRNGEYAQHVAWFYFGLAAQ